MAKSFNGTEPTFALTDAPKAEMQAVAEWLRRRVSDGVLPHEIGVFVRSDAELPRAVDAVAKAGLDHVILDERVDTRSGRVAVATMHYAKGLEFRAVAVMACEDEVVPLPSRIAASGKPVTWRTSTTPSATCCTSRARERVIIS